MKRCKNLPVCVQFLIFPHCIKNRPPNGPSLSVYIRSLALRNDLSVKDLPLLLKPISDKISEIQEFREKNRRSEFFNHLSAISESIPALGRPPSFFSQYAETPLPSSIR